MFSASINEHILTMIQIMLLHSYFPMDHYVTDWSNEGTKGKETLY